MNIKEKKTKLGTKITYTIKDNELKDFKDTNVLQDIANAFISKILKRGEK